MAASLRPSHVVVLVDVCELRSEPLPVPGYPAPPGARSAEAIFHAVEQALLSLTDGADEPQWNFRLFNSQVLLARFVNCATP